MAVRIAFDVGGVILDYDNELLLQQAILSIRGVVNKFKQENVFIISKAGLLMRESTMNRLKANNFFQLSGLLVDNVHFVMEYEDKAPKCAELKIKYMIDDNWKVIKTILNCDVTPVWFGEKGDYKLAGKHSNVVFCRNWKGVRKLFDRVKKI